MSPETIALIFTTLGGIAAMVKSMADAKRAQAEKEKAEIEAKRADEAEKTTNAVIAGVERAKRTVCNADLAQYLQDEIQIVAEERGVEERLNKMVKRVKNTTFLDRSKLIDKLEE
jgi:hypothetical protein